MNKAYLSTHLEIQWIHIFSLLLKADLVCSRAGTTWVEWGSLGAWAVLAPVDKVSIGMLWKPSDGDQAISLIKHRGYIIVVWSYSITLKILKTQTLYSICTSIVCEIIIPHSFQRRGVWRMAFNSWGTNWGFHTMAHIHFNWNISISTPCKKVSGVNGLWRLFNGKDQKRKQKKKSKNDHHENKSSNAYMFQISHYNDISWPWIFSKLANVLTASALVYVLLTWILCQRLFWTVVKL